MATPGNTKKQIVGGIVGIGIGIVLAILSQVAGDDAVPEYVRVLRYSGFACMIGAIFWIATCLISSFGDSS